ncbi:MAG: AI-2E family transporter, partial [Ignavibacteriae bacterium]|nr:AI-2E family transporter [Ignavibacteriota bacterium]
SAILFVLWFFNSISGLLAPFVIAFLIAYILNPLVVRLEQKRWPRWVSSLVLVFLSIAVVVTALLFVVPVAVRQFESIINAIADVTRSASDFVVQGRLFELLGRFGISVDEARQFISETITPRIESFLRTLFEGIFGFVSGVSSLAFHLINVIIIPFLIFYILKDFPDVTGRLSGFIPAQNKERAGEIVAKIDKILGKYFRGAVIVAAIQGTLSGVVLWIVGVDYALVLGIMTGILNFIPYIGLITSLIVASIVALFSGGPVLAKVLSVIILYLSQKLLEATVLGPKIIGAEVGLHPVLLILCLMVFGYFLGFIGLLIAVPATALIVAAVQEWEERRSRNVVVREEM